MIVNDKVAKWEASRFKTEFSDEELAFNFEPGTVTEVQSSPYAPPFNTNPETRAIDVDTTNDFLYLDIGNGVWSFTPGTPEEPARQTGPTVEVFSGDFPWPG